MQLQQYTYVMVDFGDGSHKPAVIISPDLRNEELSTVIVAPIVKNRPDYPTRVLIKIKNEFAHIVIDQLRTISKHRLVSPHGLLSSQEISAVQQAMREMFGI